MDQTIEVGLFEFGVEGVRLLGRSSDPELIELVRDHLTRRLSPKETPTVRLVPRLEEEPRQGSGSGDEE